MSGLRRGPTETNYGPSRHTAETATFKTRGGRGGAGEVRIQGPGPAAPLCDIPSGCSFFTGPWTVTRSSLRLLHRVNAF